jgi:S-methylmethionine-dependent homocysteine/selenocysteine methylase
MSQLASAPAGAGRRLLDGATATELQRRGISVDAPWWTSQALRSAPGRAILSRIHAEFIVAGAGVITANTFRTSRRSLAGAGVAEQDAAAYVAAALTAARDARKMAATEGPAARVVIAASVAPVADCYRPDQVPDNDVLRAEHRWHTAQMARHGAELLLAETMNCVREALAALASGKRTGLPVWVSFVCGTDGRLLSGESAARAAQAVQAAGADAVLVNCTSLAGCEAALADIREAGLRIPLGCYPNIEDRSGVPAQHVNHYLEPAMDPDELATAVTALAADYRLSFIGGCCGTSPRHIEAIRELWHPGGREAAKNHGRDECVAPQA